MHILIAGGGIGGLTSALCCAHFGAAVTVLEQSDQIREVGAGLQLSPNAMKVYQALGLADEIARLAFKPEALEMRLGQSGQSIFSVPITRKTEQKWGAPYLHIHRSDLIAVLLSAVQRSTKIRVKLGHTVIGYEQLTQQVQTFTAEGGRLAADLLIGADGIHSLIRQQMCPEAPARFTGNVAWRAVVPTERLGSDLPPPTACIWVGAKRHAVTYRLRQGKLCNFVGVIEREDWTEESWTLAGTRAEALADFEGWHPTLTRLIENADQQFRWALYDRAPLPRWSEGRVALLGDACHPTLPFMAQGAALAIEDAYLLAKRVCQNHPEDISHNLERYFQQRIQRASSVQRGSRKNMHLFHKSSWLSKLTTYGPMWLAGQLAPGFIRSRQDPIYSYDVTTLE